MGSLASSFRLNGQAPKGSNVASSDTVGQKSVPKTAPWQLETFKPVHILVTHFEPWTEKAIKLVSSPFPDLRRWQGALLSAQLGQIQTLRVDAPSSVSAKTGWWAGPLTTEMTASDKGKTIQPVAFFKGTEAWVHPYLSHQQVSVWLELLSRTKTTGSQKVPHISADLFRIC